MMMQRFNTNERGFLLVETLVSLTLFAFAASAIGTVAVLTFQGHRTTSGNALAAQIAQDGMELVINKRSNHVQCVTDSTCSTISNWDDNLKNPNPAQVDATLTDQLKPGSQFDAYDSAHTICRIESGTNAGKFGICSNVSGTEISGGYNRKITLESPTGPPRWLDITVTITWNDEGEDKSYTLQRVVYGPKD